MIKSNGFSLFFGMLFVCFLFSACGGAKTDEGQYTIDKNSPFIVGDVYYQAWVSGVKEGGSGINIYITFQTFQKGVVVEDIYFRGKITKAQKPSKIQNKYTGYFKTGKPRDVIMDSDPLKEAQNIPSLPFPFELKDDEVVISYLYNDRMKYARFSDIREEEMLAYPQSNLNDEN